MRPGTRRASAAAGASRVRLPSTPRSAPELRAAVAQLDVPWARSAPGPLGARALHAVRDEPAPRLLRGAARDRWGEACRTLKGPVIMVANHASHMDTPVILSALPRRLRKRTAVAAAADYFYRNRFVAAAVSLFFNTVPVERSGGRRLVKDGSHLDSLLDDGWNLLLYPEGRARAATAPAVSAAAPPYSRPTTTCRSCRSASPAPPRRCRPGRSGRSGCAARSGCSHDATGSRCRSASRSRPQEDTAALIERVQSFFDGNGEATGSRSPYRRRGRSGTLRGATPPDSELAHSGKRAYGRVDRPIGDRPIAALDHPLPSSDGCRQCPGWQARDRRSRTDGRFSLCSASRS